LINKKFKDWFNNQKKINKISVKTIDISKAENWNISKSEIAHTTKKFFKIIGIRINSNFYKKNWDQPIILQNEVGILGIIKNIKNNKYLLQAKVEPGNKNKIQLSPTVQATRSNYTQAHGGKNVPYVSFFLDIKKKNIFNQSEQGFRYLNKFNSNILIKTKKKIILIPGFVWVSLKQLIKMIKIKNFINMDTLSVISSNISPNELDNPVNNNSVVKNWLKNKDKLFFLRTKIVPLSQLKDWKYNQKTITHKNKKHFSIIAVKVQTNKREVSHWCQPILKGKSLAMAGFIQKKIGDTNHYLCRYILKPGLKKSVLTCTVNTSDVLMFKKDNNLSLFQKNILINYFMNNKYKKFINYDNVMSDEGGRFYHCEIRYMGISFKKDFNIKLPSDYIWISKNQMIDLIKKKKIDIEGRLLFGCLNIHDFN
tara:strand:- start:1095 stop:2366 length:1272 start_codon:yes stop_codon:yes gene_type:complete